MENTSMRSVIWHKVTALVRDYTILDLVKTTIYLFVTFIMCTVTVDNGALATKIMEWHNGAIPNITLILVASYFAPRVARSTWYHLVESIDNIKPVLASHTDNTQTIEGMDTDSVIEHLITRSTFRREEIESKFGVPRYRYSALVKKLKELGVLITGENNMSVFNSKDWTRASLQQLFAGKETAQELERVINIVKSSPTPVVFRKRPVSCAAQYAAAYATNVQPGMQRVCSPCAAQ